MICFLLLTDLPFAQRETVTKHSWHPGLSNLFVPWPHGMPSTNGVRAGASYLQIGSLLIFFLCYPAKTCGLVLVLVFVVHDESEPRMRRCPWYNSRAMDIMCHSWLAIGILPVNDQTIKSGFRDASSVCCKPNESSQRASLATYLWHDLSSLPCQLWRWCA